LRHEITLRNGNSPVSSYKKFAEDKTMKRRKSRLNQMSFNKYANPKNGWNNILQRAAKSISAGRLKDAQTHLEQALTLAEESSHPGKRAETHTLLGWLLEGLNDIDQAIDHFKRAAAIASVVWGSESDVHAHALHHLAEAIMFKGDFEQAASLALTSHQIIASGARKQDKMAKYFLPTSLTLMARISFRRGDIEGARKWLEVYAQDRGMRAELEMLSSEDLERLFYNVDAPKETIKQIPARIATFAHQF
jgi:tetratricopeptide (TPR) repeat protein